MVPFQPSCAQAERLPRSQAAKQSVGFGPLGCYSSTLSSKTHGFRRSGSPWNLVNNFRCLARLLCPKVPSLSWNAQCAPPPPFDLSARGDALSALFGTCYTVFKSSQRRFSNAPAPILNGLRVHKQSRTSLKLYF